MTINLDTNQSVYRERLLEHLLIGDLLKYSWLYAGATLEVSYPSIDRSGHDVVLEANGVTRHVQLKSSGTKAATANQKVHVGLVGKPSGCVIWTRFDRDSIDLGPFMFFGAEPGAPLPSLDDFRTAKHTKCDASGVKKERPNLRIVPAAKFRRSPAFPLFIRRCLVQVSQPVDRSPPPGVTFDLKTCAAKLAQACQLPTSRCRLCDAEMFQQLLQARMDHFLRGRPAWAGDGVR